LGGSTWKIKKFLGFPFGKERCTFLEESENANGVIQASLPLYLWQKPWHINIVIRRNQSLQIGPRCRWTTPNALVFYSWVLLPAASKREIPKEMTCPFTISCLPHLLLFLVCVVNNFDRTLQYAFSFFPLSKPLNTINVRASAVHYWYFLIDKIYFFYEKKKEKVKKDNHVCCHFLFMTSKEEK
jgi:hypothetical protein